MQIRWRLAILFVQLILLTIGTYAVTKEIISTQTWYLAGLLAVIINPQLLEPFYPRPGDVIANSILCIALLVTTTHVVAKTAWDVFFFILIFTLALGLIAIMLALVNKLQIRWRESLVLSHSKPMLVACIQLFSGLL